MMDHSFVVPVYGRSPHLVDCLTSLRSQSVHSPIVLASSTPFDGLDDIAETHGAKLVLHGPNRGIGRDWNAAVDAAETAWVTIAHQDDVYLPDFSAEVTGAIAANPDANLVFTDYAELYDDRPRIGTPMLRIKKALLELGFLGRARITRTGPKKRLLRFGCPIPCPAVTLNRATSRLQFDEQLKVDLDWDAWIQMADQGGSFCYVRKVLMHHRIHGGSETTAGIRAGIRAAEDLRMFESMWPRPLARVLARAYSMSYADGSA